MRLAASALSVLLLTTVGLSNLLAACSPKPEAKSSHAEAKSHSVAGPKLTRWDYDGEEGPGHWGQLGGDNTTCALGHRQSPINLTGMPSAKSVNLRLDYNSSTATIQNSGHSIQVSPSDGGAVIMDGVEYKLSQIHFHTPSEHTINGHRSAMETHFVHKNAKGELLVIGVLSDIGVADPMLAPIWTYLPSDAGPASIIPDALLNARDLMPATEEFYVYSGSLTTPPCSENVTWMVYASPLSISAEQIDVYQRLVGSNARPVQEAKGRNILHVIGG
jgi:carbonic anhydrase